MREMGDNSFETLLEEQKNAHFTSKKDEKITRLFDLGRGKRANLANVNPQERRRERERERAVFAITHANVHRPKKNVSSVNGELCRGVSDSVTAAVVAPFFLLPHKRERSGREREIGEQTERNKL